MFSIIGKRFTVSEFAEYVAGIPLTGFRPSMVVLHNTGIPTLAQRPAGFTEAHMNGLRSYYAVTNGWSGGPHLFVDDHGIWVFNPLDRKGVHSPSWNSVSWGVEMLGDFEKESFSEGRGKIVRANAVQAVAMLLRKLGIEQANSLNFKLHRQDPKTTHACPGSHVVKVDVMHEINEAMLAVDGKPAKIVVYRKAHGGQPFAVIEGKIMDGVLKADGAKLAEATGLSPMAGTIGVREFVGGRFAIAWNAAQGKAYLTEI